MIVVSDTSPLTALLAIGQGDLLTKLFGDVVIPPAVKSELLRTHSVLPAWLRVQALRDNVRAGIYARSVDRGEAEAIALAEELHADHLLIDERKGRRLAQEQGLPSWDYSAWSCWPSANGLSRPHGNCWTAWIARQEFILAII